MSLNPNHEHDYDVVVVGAGPAGLSVASELAEKYKVLVVDARPEQPRGKARLAACEADEASEIPASMRVNKSWFSPHDCLYDNPDLVECRKPTGVTRFLARTFSGPTGEDPERFDLAWSSRLFSDAPLADRYPYLDEYKLIAHWEQKIFDSVNRSCIRSAHFYKDHQTFSDHVQVRFLTASTDPADSSGGRSETYRCRLLLDASGHDSDIRKVYGEQQKNVYWWTVFGAICTHPEGEIVTTPTAGHPLVVGDYMLWQTFAASNVDPSTPLHQGRPVLEYEILDERTSFPLILFLRPYKITLERAKAEFENILRGEPSAQAFKNAEITELKFGHYPSGRNFRSYAQDRVDFIGDAGLWTTPCGWGASFILKNYAPYCRLLDRLLEEDRLDTASLRSLPRRHAKQAEFFMNTVVTRFLSFGTVQQLDQFIALFRELDPVVCERIFTLRADPLDLWRFARLAARRMGVLPLLCALPRHERLQLLTDLAQAALQFAKESALQRLGREPERGFGVFAER